MRYTCAVALLAFTAAMGLVHANASREELINAAIQEVRAAESLAAAQHKEAHAHANTAEQLLRAFKRASKESIQEGKARVRFEKMIHKAERKIIENERQKLDPKDNLAKAEKIAKELIHKPGTILTSQEIARIHQESECEKPAMRANCLLQQNQMYRTVTGVCNNLKNPLLGSSRTPFRRLISAQYEDGISQLRGAMQGSESPVVGQSPFSPPNPSARIISLSVVQDQPLVNPEVSHMMMQWGQFIDHDLDLAPAFKEPCEGCEANEHCVPIRVPISDQTFGDSSQSEICHPFPRSIPVCSPNTEMEELEPREQLNELNSFLDGSQIYGSSQNIFDAVREPNSALLRTGPNIPANGGPSLPVDTQNLVECMNGGDCFLAGDVRVNEHAALTIMHTIWVREHNRVAMELQRMNPSWTTEKVFQVSRAIVGAEVQKITYVDYLPVLLGRAMYNRLIGDYEGYKPDVNPAVPNAFASAAFRFGHSQIQPFFDRLNSSYLPLSIGPLNLVDSFFDPSQYEQSEGTDPILRGLLSGTARKVDEFVNDVLTNHLFQTSTSVGMDLASLNIQRGRDHGLPPYLTWKRWAQRECNISSDFENDLTQVRLLQTYGTLETVDLWVGGLAEENVPRGLVGATFACIFAKTFRSLRDGDRFYYENSDSSALFNAQQRAAIRDASLSRIICDNSDSIDSLPRNAFRTDLGRIPCSAIPAVDLTLWSNSTQDDNRCYLQTKVNNMMGDVTIFSQSKVGYSGKSTIFKTTTSGSTTTCVPILCPPEDQKGVYVGVSNKGNGGMRCRVQKNSMLPGWTFRSLYKGFITERTIENSKTGAYYSLESCNSGDTVGLTINCRGDLASSQNEKLLEELDSVMSKMDGVSNQHTVIEEVTDTDNIPEDILKELETTDPPQATLESDEQWKSKTVNLLEQLLQTLKGSKNEAQETHEATDQELFRAFSKLLKETNE